MPFELNKRLAAGGFDFGTLGQCRVLLKNNAVFPWFILVPEVNDEINELHKLDAGTYASVTNSIRQVSKFAEHYFKADKLNIATIGNIVPQLHIHIIARFESDPAWPGVIWAHADKKTYDPDRVSEILQAYETSINTTG